MARKTILTSPQGLFKAVPTVDFCFEVRRCNHDLLIGTITEVESLLDMKGYIFDKQEFADFTELVTAVFKEYC